MQDFIRRGLYGALLAGGVMLAGAAAASAADTKGQDGSSTLLVTLGTTAPEQANGTVGVQLGTLGTGATSPSAGQPTTAAVSLDGRAAPAATPAGSAPVTQAGPADVVVSLGTVEAGADGSTTGSTTAGIAPVTQAGPADVAVSLGAERAGTAAPQAPAGGSGKAAGTGALGPGLLDSGLLRNLRAVTGDPGNPETRNTGLLRNLDAGTGALNKAGILDTGLLGAAANTGGQQNGGGNVQSGTDSANQGVPAVVRFLNGLLGGFSAGSADNGTTEGAGGKPGSGSGTAQGADVVINVRSSGPGAAEGAAAGGLAATTGLAAATPRGVCTALAAGAASFAQPLRGGSGLLALMMSLLLGFVLIVLSKRVKPFAGSARAVR
ncbi:hypothetical protein [Arthrobacter cupressi]